MDVKEIEQRVGNLEGQMGGFAVELDDVKGAIGEVEGGLKDVRRDYHELRLETKELNNAQAKLQAYMEFGFKRNDDQNLQIINSLSKLSERQENVDQQNQQRHLEIIQMVHAGDQQNSREANDGDRRNMDTIATRKWDTKTTWLVVVVGVITLGVTLWATVFK